MFVLMAKQKYGSEMNTLPLPQKWDRASIGDKNYTHRNLGLYFYLYPFSFVSIFVSQSIALMRFENCQGPWLLSVHGDSL